MGLTMFTFAGYVLLLLLHLANSASNRRCFPLYDGRSVCFTQPDPSVALSWSDAQQWCSNIGATLPTPYTYSHHVVSGNALGYFGLSSKTTWLGANSTFDMNDWYWVNGTSFTGAIDHRNDTRKTHAYIIRNGTEIKIVAANPRNEYAGSICQPAYLSNNELGCANTLNSYWADGKCYTKNKYQYTWSSYTSGCGGLKNLASLDDLSEISRWIDDQTKFWIGLRCTWWTWQDIVSGRSFELTETRFNSNFPNNTSPECLATYGDTYGNMYWMNRNCSTDLQFICQQYVSPTTTTRTTRPTTTTTRRPTSTTTRTSATTKTSTPTKPSSTSPTRTTTTYTDSSSTTARKSAATPFSSLSNASLTTGLTSHVPTVMRTSEVAGTPSMAAQFTKSTPGSSDTNEAMYNKYGLFVLLGFGLFGGLLIAVIVCLATLTARVYKNYRYSPKTLQKRPIGNIQLTYSNPYEIPPFDDSPPLKEGPLSAIDGAEKPFEELQV